ncbi:hypothetical protein Tco_0858677 [Tanacetum coccineum]|uniref:Uncharacterized protein n=1 Tax=Tanacetum coccineum TaxID=301880 RepID=A0ABQ5B9Y1_9ASTR
MPYDSPLTRVNTLRSDEGSMTQQELMVFCTTLLKKVESLETNLKQTKQLYGVAYTKLIKKVKKLEKTVKSSQARRRARIVVSDDEDNLVDPSKHERKIAKSDQDPDISLEDSTAEKDVGTAETKLQQEQERLGFEADVRLQAKLEEEERQRIAKVHEVAISFNVEEWEDIQARVVADEELAQRLQAEEREKYTEVEQARMLAELINQIKRYFAAKRQLRGYSFDEIKTLFETTMRRVNTFVPIESEVDKAVAELAARSLKRAVEEELDKGSSKRHCLVKEKFNSTKPIDDKEREIWVELKRLFEPDTDDEFWKLQKNIHDLTWKLYDSCGVHHVSTEKGIDIYMRVEKEYPLSRGTLTLLLVAKLLVEQDNKMSRELLRKIFMQAERPRR